jgi:hypothetical protein
VTAIAITVLDQIDGMTVIAGTEDVVPAGTKLTKG